MYVCRNIYIDIYWITKSLCTYTHCTHTRTVHVEGERCSSFIMCAAPQGSTTHRLDLWSWKNTQAPFHLMLFFPSYTANLSLPPFSHEPHGATTRDKWANWPTVYTTLFVCVLNRETEEICAQMCVFCFCCMCVYMLAHLHAFYHSKQQQQQL